MKYLFFTTLHFLMKKLFISLPLHYFLLHDKKESLANGE